MGIRALTASDLEDYRRLRQRALEEEPRAFFSSPAEDAQLTDDTVAKRISASEEQFVLGAYDGARLVGMVGFFRQHKAKARHTAMVWGVYVEPEQRGRRLGRALCEALIERARQLPGLEILNLAVDVANEPAFALYQALGFETWGIEPDAFRVDGVPVREAHMRLVL